MLQLSGMHSMKCGQVVWLLSLGLASVRFSYCHDYEPNVQGLQCMLRTISNHTVFDSRTQNITFLRYRETYEQDTYRSLVEFADNS